MVFGSVYTCECPYQDHEVLLYFFYLDLKKALLKIVELATEEEELTATTVFYILKWKNSIGMKEKVLTRSASQKKNSIIIIRDIAYDSSDEDHVSKRSDQIDHEDFQKFKIN